MILAKEHLRNIRRTKPEQFNRMNYLRLDKNEDPSGIPDELVSLWKQTITPDRLAAYPQLNQLYHKLSKYLSVPEECIFISGGSDAAIKSVFEAYISPRDKILIPHPTFMMYEIYSDLFQADLIKIPYPYNLAFPFNETLREINDGVRLLVVVNPNNPTGTVIEKDNLLTLLDRAKDAGCLVLVDEAYYPFHPETCVDLIKKYDNLVVTRTFSKAFGLAAARLGFAVASPDIIDNLNKVRPIYETNELAAELGCIVLDNIKIISEHVNDILNGRDHLITNLNKMGFVTYPSHTNFVNINVGEDDIFPIIEFFKQNGILIKNGGVHPLLRKCVRITAGPNCYMDRVLEVMRRWKL